MTRYEAVIGLEIDELLDIQPQLRDAGNPTLLIALRSKEAVDRAWLDSQFDDYAEEVGDVEAQLFDRRRWLSDQLDTTAQSVQTGNRCAYPPPAWLRTLDGGSRE